MRGFAMAMAAALAGCSAPATTTTTTTSTAPLPSTGVATCDAVRPRVEGLYRAEAEQREPKRAEEYVADNTAMIMNDCVKEPARFAPCLANAATVAAMEQECVIPLDDEGTEGEAHR